MPKKKRKKKKKSNSKTPQSNIPKSASTTRFLIFLAIGLILFGIFYYFAYIRGGGGAMEDIG